MQVQESAGAETRNGVYVTAAEAHELNGSKGTANFVMVSVCAGQAAGISSMVCI